MELAESIYDDNGRFLARQGARLSSNLADRLARLLGNRTIAVRRYAPSGEDAADAEGH
jgi:hypothetical protein